MRRHAAVAALLLAITGAIAACRDSNITPPLASAEGGIIVFASNRSDANFELYRVGADGRGLRRLTTSVNVNDRAPAVSPDGRRIAWEQEIGVAGGGVASVEIWTMTVDGGDARPAVRNGSFNRTPSWGPAGELVYTSRVSGSDQIFRLDAGAAEPVRLTTGGAADQYPRLSPDGQRVVFQSNRGLDFDIHAMNRDGTGVTNLTRFAGDDRFPTWTPDGARIVWTRFDERSSTFDLFVMAADGSAQRALLSTPFTELNPSVSPDGRSVVYQTDRTPPFTLYVVPVDGGSGADNDGRPLRTVSNVTAGSDLTPWWGPTP